MKFRFKVQPYQTAAVESVVDCFAGQLRNDGIRYRIDPGTQAQASSFEEGFKNTDIQLSDVQVLENVRAVQRRQNLLVSDNLVVSAGCKYNLDVEMETGTGKTYVYIKTIMELHRRYGWSRFIVVVPSIAIREGVKATFDTTAEHFGETYGTKPRSFVYSSSRLHELEGFASDPGVQVMIINIQAFNAAGKENRRIYEELDGWPEITDASGSSTIPPGAARFVEHVSKLVGVPVWSTSWGPGRSQTIVTRDPFMS